MEVVEKTMTITKQAGLRAIALAGLALGIAGSALAHHSYAEFDMSQEKVITGKILKFDWSNPHTWAWINVPNEKGGVDTWGVEGMSPNYLARRGWNRTTLKPGDEISVTMRPCKDTAKFCGTWVSGKRPNGEVLMMGGAITDP